MPSEPWACRGSIAANLKLRKRQRGFSEGQMIESVVLLQTIGGDCPDDIRLLATPTFYTEAFFFWRPEDFLGFFEVHRKRSSLHFLNFAIS